ncbi:MAG: hypothetical protein EB017_10915 [Betaproteobacteria bacterium]|nr:hypothetical protein [Betaproteobacteria bacterium]
MGWRHCFEHTVAILIRTTKTTRFIGFSGSRTRNTTDRYKGKKDLEIKLRNALERIDPKRRTTEEKALLEELKQTPQINLLHLIYHHKEYESDNKDYEFSKLTMEEVIGKLGRFEKALSGIGWI